MHLRLHLRRIDKKVADTKKCKESPGYRISERVSFILNVPHGWKFSGKVAIGTVIPEHVLLNQHLELRTGFLKEI